MKNKTSLIKQTEDARLMSLIQKLQQQITTEQELDQTTLDMSEDNIIATKILQAKYNFVYNEARDRKTKYSGITSAITQ